MKIYKVPLTFEVFLTEKELTDLDATARNKIITLMELDGVSQVMELGEVGEPHQLSSKEEQDFIEASKDAYQTQIMAIANGLAKDPYVTADEAQEILRRNF